MKNNINKIELKIFYLMKRYYIYEQGQKSKTKEHTNK